MGTQSLEDSRKTYWDEYQMIKTGDCLKEVTVGQMRRFFTGDAEAVTAEQGRVLTGWADGLNRLEARYNEAAGPSWHATPFRNQTIAALTALLGIPPDVIATRRAEVLESITETAHEMNALRGLRDMEHDLYRLIDSPAFMTNGLSGDLDWTKLFDSVIAIAAIRSALEAREVAWWSPEIMVAVEGHVSSKLVALGVAERRNEADDIPGREAAA